MTRAEAQRLVERGLASWQPDGWLVYTRPPRSLWTQGEHLALPDVLHTRVCFGARCPCGGVILADTDDWKVPRCFDCWHALGEPSEEP